MNDTTVADLMETIEAKLAEFEFACGRGEHATGYHALRLYPDGTVHAVHEVSKSCGESEYFGRVPHALTFHVSGGANFSPDPTTGWAWIAREDGPYLGNMDGKGSVENFDSLEDDEIDRRIGAGEVRFDLDLEDWCGEPLDLSWLLGEIEPKVEEWVEAGNYRPADRG